MKYLFIDIKWNKKGVYLKNYKLIQLAAVCMNEDFVIEKEFFKIICPQNSAQITNMELHSMHLSRKVLEQAKSQDTVLKNFMVTFPRFPQDFKLVIWDRKSILIFKNAIKEAGFDILDKYVIILQDLISKKENISFLKACDIYNVKYDERLLGCSKHDVIYLKKLFGSYMYSCKNKEYITNYVFSEEKVSSICNMFGLNCSFSNGIVFVTTNVGRWRIIHEGNNIKKIYHENYRRCKSEFSKKHKKCTEGYHEQQIEVRDFYDAIKYIYCHDKNFVSSMTNSYDIRMRELFQMIDEQQKKSVY